MEQVYVEEKTFDKADFTANPLAKGDYENCVFKNCNFSNSDLAALKFIECEFWSCNVSLATLTGTAFRDVRFKDCKMLGLLFYTCNDFGFSVSFDNCILNHASFYGVKIKKTLFKNVRLIEVDFTDCDVSHSVFDACDLAGAKFENTVLEKADLRTAFNYSIDPERNRIKKARFSLTGIAGLLDTYDIEIDT